jgi:hypothetical protein
MIKSMLMAARGATRLPFKRLLVGTVVGVALTLVARSAVRRFRASNTNSEGPAGADAELADVVVAEADGDLVEAEERFNEESEGPVTTEVPARRTTG